MDEVEKQEKRTGKKNGYEEGKNRKQTKKAWGKGIVTERNIGQKRNEGGKNIERQSRKVKVKLTLCLTN
jgi:hypothetical protein